MSAQTLHEKNLPLAQRTIAKLVPSHRPRLVVLSLKKEIASALAEGLTLIELWQQLHGEGAFPAGYDRFRILVRRFITQSPRKASRPRPTPTAPAATGFTFTPTANPKDLV